MSEQKNPSESDGRIGSAPRMYDVAPLQGAVPGGRARRACLTVDLGPLKAGLEQYARARGVRPSRIVREALAPMVGGAEHALARTPRSRDGRVRIDLRLTDEQADRLRAAARAAGLSFADYVVGVVDGIAVLNGGRPADHLAALVASNSDLVALSRDLRSLTNLLRMGSASDARRYRERLDEVDVEVRQHLRLVAQALAELRPSRATRREERP